MPRSSIKASATRKGRRQKQKRPRRPGHLLANAGLVLVLVVLGLALVGALTRMAGLWGSESDQAHHLTEAVTPTPGGTGQPEASPSPPQQVGPLEVSATQVDLGRVALGQQVTPRFQIRNAGQEPLTLVVAPGNVQTLEGC